MPRKSGIKVPRPISFKKAGKLKDIFKLPRTSKLKMPKIGLLKLPKMPKFKVSKEKIKFPRLLRRRSII